MGGREVFQRQREGPIITIFGHARSPCKGPAQTAALARIPQRPPPASPPPSFSFFPFSEQARAPGSFAEALPERRREEEARRPRPDPRLPPRLLLYPQTNHMEPAVAVEGGGGAGLGRKGGVLLGEPDNKELTSRQEAICATQINFTAPGSVRGAAST